MNTPFLEMLDKITQPSAEAKDVERMANTLRRLDREELAENLEHIENMVMPIACPAGVNHDDWRGLKEVIECTRELAARMAL